MDYDARDMLLTTDAPTDKIVYLATGNIPIDGYPHSITHTLPFRPLVSGYWSMTPDFSVCYEFFSGDFPSGNPFQLFAHSVDIFCDTDTTIDLYTRDIAGGSKTCYYRIFAFEPHGLNNDLSTPVAQSDSMILNTDYNYMKLYMSGTANPGTAGTYTIAHNLGYIPRVMAWASKFGSLEPVMRAGDTATGETYVTVDATNIVFKNPYGINVPELHYRIYLDD